MHHVFLEHFELRPKGRSKIVRKPDEAIDHIRD